MNRVDEIYGASSNATEFGRQYGQYLAELLAAMPYEEIERFVDVMFEARAKKKTIFFIGNGGSAATASHFANDIGIGPRHDEEPFKVLSLCDNQAVITAIGNDFGYDHIFSKQLIGLMTPGDCLVAISASGNSPNIIKAVELAKGMGNAVVGLTGFDGGKLRELSDVKIHVDTKKGEYGPVEDLHMIVDHLVGSYINRKIKE